MENQKRIINLKKKGRFVKIVEINVSTEDVNQVVKIEEDDVLEIDEEIGEDEFKDNSLVNENKILNKDISKNIMADHFKGGKVLTISRKDFDSSFKLKKSPGKNSLIVFHQPWCGFCLQLAPEYKKISTKVYSVNGELPGSDEVFAHFAVTGFPTIRFLSKDGKVGSKTYLGERDASSMMKFIKSAGMSGGAKKKVVKKKQKGGCVGKSCNGKCHGGKCGSNKLKKQIDNLFRKYDKLDSEYEDTHDDEIADKRDNVYLKMEKLTIKYLKEGGKFKDLELSSNWRKSDFQKGGAKKCKCKGKCSGGKCKAQKGGAKKRGRGRPKDSSLKKIKKAVKKSLKKSLKKVKKMLGGKKKKAVKKSIKKRKPKRKTIKKRRKK